MNDTYALLRDGLCQNGFWKSLEERGKPSFFSLGIEPLFPHDGHAMVRFLRDAAHCWHYFFLVIQTEQKNELNTKPLWGHSARTSMAAVFSCFNICDFSTDLNNVKHVVPPKVTYKTHMDWPLLDWVRKTVFKLSAMSFLSFRSPFYHVWFFLLS